MGGADPFRPGFDPRWRSEEDFVLGITRGIWEDRGVANLRQWYAPDLVVRSPAGVATGNEAIVAATLATLAEFPDRELLGEDVIWCDAGPDAFLSSHRLFCTATHLGAGAYGAPTGRRLAYRILADCHCRADAVRDEWLVRDQGAIVRQMGLDPAEWTREAIAREGGPERCARPFTPDRDVEGPYGGRGDGGEWGALLAGVLERIMAGELSAIGAEYDRACEVHYAGGASGHGRAAADRHWLALRAAFPSARFERHHAMGSDGAGARMPPRAAVRWSLTGRHDGHGPYGPPTGAEVHVMGITHAEFGPRGLRREWTLVDETAIWRQILLATGAAGA